MTSQSSQINLPLTVEANLQRARGDFLTRFPADPPHSHNTIQFDVRYLGERIPDSLQAVDYLQPSDAKATLSKDPVYLSIQRPDMGVTMLRDETVERLSQKKVVSYSMTVRHQRESYQLVATSAGFVKEYGSKAAIDALQHDPEFAKYLSFVTPDNMQEIIHSKPKAWNLDRIFDGQKR